MDFWYFAVASNYYRSRYSHILSVEREKMLTQMVQKLSRIYLQFWLSIYEASIRTVVVFLYYSETWNKTFIYANVDKILYTCMHRSQYTFWKEHAWGGKGMQSKCSSLVKTWEIRGKSLYTLLHMAFLFLLVFLTVRVFSTFSLFASLHHVSPISVSQGIRKCLPFPLFCTLSMHDRNWVKLKLEVFSMSSSYSSAPATIWERNPFAHFTRIKISVASIILHPAYMYLAVMWME